MLHACAERRLLCPGHEVSGRPVGGVTHHRNWPEAQGEGLAEVNVELAIDIMRLVSFGIYCAYYLAHCSASFPITEAFNL